MKRMEQLKRLLPKDAVLADIGTDHAYLPILAVSDHTIQKAYACDVAPGPLSQAEENIRKAGLEEKIIPILSDGFDRVPMDATAAVIAGMGFYTARDILERAEARLPLLSDIIVQINQDVPLLRQWISDHRYTIRKELSLSERGKYYSIIDFNTNPHAAYERAELLCGDLSAVMDREALMDELRFRMRKLADIIERRGGDAPLQEELQILRSVYERLGVFCRPNSKC